MTIHFGDSTTLTSAGSLGKLVGYASNAYTAATISQSLGEGNVSNDFMVRTYAANSSSNKILMTGVCTIGWVGSGALAIHLYVDGSAVMQANASGSIQRTTASLRTGSQYNSCSIPFSYIHSSPSTSTVNYSVRVSHGDNNTQTVYLNRPHNTLNAAYQFRGTSQINLLEFTA